MKTLILFAHPRLEKSKINKALLARVPKHPDLYFNDLYEAYPDFNIDINREKELLVQHDMIIWQHPFYWYSCPPLLKQWIDLVLEFGWAYGPGGNSLVGKKIFNAVTTGGATEAYRHEGRNRFTVQEFLAPFDQTAHLCKMQYLPPFAIQGTNRLADDNLV
jgi:glutathione-regulated potassium-efflux system ancillary protein KefG